VVIEPCPEHDLFVSVHGNHQPLDLGQLGAAGSYQGFQPLNKFPLRSRLLLGLSPGQPLLSTLESFLGLAIFAFAAVRHALNFPLVTAVDRIRLRRGEP
jgi:hypothetical protein